tara:strand:+ start:339 stop:551 length:213 start_codon:yes stop_codon:yes gene_type:complete
MKKQFAKYNRHYKDNAEGHIFLQNRGDCNATLSVSCISQEGSVGMSQKELDKYAEIMVKALNEHADKEKE